MASTTESVAIGHHSDGRSLCVCVCVYVCVCLCVCGHWPVMANYRQRTKDFKTMGTRQNVVSLFTSSFHYTFHISEA